MPGRCRSRATISRGRRRGNWWSDTLPLPEVCRKSVYTSGYWGTYEACCWIGTQKCVSSVPSACACCFVYTCACICSYVQIHILCTLITHLNYTHTHTHTHTHTTYIIDNLCTLIAHLNYTHTHTTYIIHNLCGLRCTIHAPMVNGIGSDLNSTSACQCAYLRTRKHMLLKRQ